VSSHSGASAAEGSAGQTGHCDTPTGLFVSPGDVLVSKFQFVVLQQLQHSHAQGFAPN
jgi:hypothetical protein